MVKVEIDLPTQIYGFLEAAAKFSGLFPKLGDTAEKFIQAYIIEATVSSVNCDVNSIGGSYLWDEKNLRIHYGLDEVEVDP